jgi:hypothetical protein
MKVVIYGSMSVMKLGRKGHNFLPSLLKYTPNARNENRHIRIMRNEDKRSRRRRRMKISAFS